MEPPTILIVDDDPEWRDFVAGVLSEQYPVRCASCGQDGLRMARETRPGAILLDVIMPSGIDGFRVLCELRKDPLTRKIPVIILSSVNALTDSMFDADMLQQYLGVAPSAFLEKPVNPEVLLTELARVLDEAATPSCDGA